VRIVAPQKARIGRATTTTPATRRALERVQAVCAGHDHQHAQHPAEELEQPECPRLFPQHADAPEHSRCPDREQVEIVPEALLGIAAREASGAEQPEKDQRTDRESGRRHEGEEPADETKRKQFHSDTIREKFVKK